ncbi:MAG: hypothetical protein QM803_11770 [Rhodocyclaceae bacterium]
MRTRQLLLPAFALVACISMAACSKSSDTGTAPTDSGAATSAPEAPAAPPPAPPADMSAPGADMSAPASMDMSSSSASS